MTPELKLVAWGAGLLLGGAALGWLLEDPTAPTAGGLIVADSAKLVEIAPVDTQADLALLQSKNLWGLAVANGPAAGQAIAAPSSFRLTGVVTKVDPPLAVLLLGGPKPATVYKHLNDELPDGSRIVAIAADRVTVELDGKRRELKLFKTSL